jgi:hypothetical protein
MTTVSEGGRFGDAILSECRTYRYVLRFQVDPLLAPKGFALFLMLNPSTADADNPDPTIRKCMGFARRFRCSRVTVANLFALRATYPDDLRRHPDPVGPENDTWIAHVVQEHRERGALIIAAWGADPFAKTRARHVLRSFGPFDCLGVTADGSPRHPLYLPYESRLVGVDEAVLG